MKVLRSLRSWSSRARRRRTCWYSHRRGGLSVLGRPTTSYCYYYSTSSSQRPTATERLDLYYEKKPDVLPTEEEARKAELQSQNYALEPFNETLAYLVTNSYQDLYPTLTSDHSSVGLLWPFNKPPHKFVTEGDLPDYRDLSVNFTQSTSQKKLQGIILSNYFNTLQDPSYIMNLQDIKRVVQLIKLFRAITPNRNYDKWRHELSKLVLNRLPETLKVERDVTLVNFVLNHVIMKYTVDAIRLIIEALNWRVYTIEECLRVNYEQKTNVKYLDFAKETFNTINANTHIIFTLFRKLPTCQLTDAPNAHQRKLEAVFYDLYDKTLQLKAPYSSNVNLVTALLTCFGKVLARSTRSALEHSVTYEQRAENKENAVEFVEKSYHQLKTWHTQKKLVIDQSSVLALIKCFPSEYNDRIWEILLELKEKYSVEFKTPTFATILIHNYSALGQMDSAFNVLRQAQQMSLWNPVDAEGSGELAGIKQVESEEVWGELSSACFYNNRIMVGLDLLSQMKSRFFKQNFTETYAAVVFAAACNLIENDYTERALTEIEELLKSRTNLSSQEYQRTLEPLQRCFTVVLLRLCSKTYSKITQSQGPKRPRANQIASTEDREGFTEARDSLRDIVWPQLQRLWNMMTAQGNVWPTSVIIKTMFEWMYTFHVPSKDVGKLWNIIKTDYLYLIDFKNWDIEVVEMIQDSKK